VRTLCVRTDCEYVTSLKIYYGYAIINQSCLKGLITMINYAHRGASEYAPENTLSSFYMGLQQGGKRDRIVTLMKKCVI